MIGIEKVKEMNDEVENSSVVDVERRSVILGCFDMFQMKG